MVYLLKNTKREGRKREIMDDQHRKRTWGEHIEEVRSVFSTEIYPEDQLQRVF